MGADYAETDIQNAMWQSLGFQVEITTEPLWLVPVMLSLSQASRKNQSNLMHEYYSKRKISPRIIFTLLISYIRFNKIRLESTQVNLIYLRITLLQICLFFYNY